MSEYFIRLKSVYSQTVLTPAGVKLPDNWSLSWHQVETLKAIRDPQIDVVINTAMTGDGKSLAIYLESLSNSECSVIGLYPTNELARDQERQINGYIESFQSELNPRVTRLSGEELEIYAENEGLRKSAAIASRTGQSDILVTNPDIFHYLHRGAYLTAKDSPDKLWGRIDKDFDLFVHDEFHVFTAPQIASTINTLLLIRHTNRRKKFIFSSATPETQLLNRLSEAGLNCQIIDPLTQDKYRFPENMAEADQLKKDGWRPILRGIDLQMIPLAPTYQASENWLKENQQIIVNYLQNNPGSKGAIILNSIATVKRLTPILENLLKSYGFTVGENTGLSSRSVKNQSLNCDLVIGTSTIDVGVDFQINFLIFESADAGNFIQRLGRLGRHDGYWQNDQFIKFENFRAIALVPNFLVERLFLGENPVLNAGEIYDRPFFHREIYNNYRKINNFTGYYRQWGAVQSAKICQGLNHKTIKMTYLESRKILAGTYEKIFNTSLGKIYGQIKGWRDDWQELSGQKSCSPIEEEASSFRGSSPLQCGIYDLTEQFEIDRFKTYDLPGILSNLDIEVMTEANFLRMLKSTVENYQQPIAKGRFNQCLAFVKLLAYRQERLDWRFIYSGDLRAIADSYQVQVLTDLQIWQPANYWINNLNQRLKKQALVSYVISKPVNEVRSILRLPMHFPIYPISDQYSVHDSSCPYSIAFGQGALLLQTLAYSIKSKGNEIWIF
jgi:CRISPR-associated endonuclease/helicase Cas3